MRMCMVSDMLLAQCCHRSLPECTHRDTVVFGELREGQNFTDEVSDA